MGTSLTVQWLRLCVSNAGAVGSIPGWGTKIPHAVRPKKNHMYKIFLKSVDDDDDEDDDDNVDMFVLLSLHTCKLDFWT